MKDEVLEEQPPKQQPRLTKYLSRLFIHCRAILASPYAQGVLVFSCLIMTFLCLVFMYLLYAKLDNRIEQNMAYLALAENHLIERTVDAEQTLLMALADSSEETLRVIRRLDTTYQGLLDAQKRRTLESLYNEEALIAERKEAMAAFTAGRYAAASRLYEEIATAHPEDQEARFYQYYALFLSNKMDRGNYRLIREALTLLERQGYTRRELTETLNFIVAETRTDGEKP